jgi:hypothetical protein
MHSTHYTKTDDQRIEQLIALLCSLIDGESAVEQLIACGDQAISHLLSFLVEEAPRVITQQPRCRAVRVLGELGAYPALRTYLRHYSQTEKSVVLLTEDAVRSAAAYELSRAKTEENFEVLMEATDQRASPGLISALGEYERPESIPILFELLENDLCTNEALLALQRVPADAGAYATLLLRGQTDLQIEGPTAERRRRATLKLLTELGMGEDSWGDSPCPP